MGALRQDCTRTDDTVLFKVLELRYANLCANRDNPNKTWTEVARNLGIWASQLSAIRSGAKLPGPTLLRKLGLRRVISYEEIK